MKYQSDDNDNGGIGEKKDVNPRVFDEQYGKKCTAALVCRMTNMPTCCICLEDFYQGEKVRMIPACEHAFHTNCILPWLTTRAPTCPLCKARAVLDEEEELDEQVQQPTTSVFPFWGFIRRRDLVFRRGGRQSIDVEYAIENRMMRESLLSDDDSVEESSEGGGQHSREGSIESLL